MVDMSCSFEALRRRRIPLFSALLILLIIAFASQRQSQDDNHSMESSMGPHEAKSKALFSGVSSAYQSHRKLLAAYENQSAAAKKVETNRIWGDKCSTSDILVYQGQGSPLPSGIPTYRVEIMNACITGCDISGIHLSCGWFSSARLINPRIFRRLSYDDCLVNDGKPLVNGGGISFAYANTFPYPLAVSAVAC